MNANAIEERPKIRRNSHALTSGYLLTGLIRCSACGFPFQGQTQKVKGHIYPKYIDGGWQSKRVCSYVAIPKEEIEAFAFSAIRDTLTNPKTIQRVEFLIAQMSEKKRIVGGTNLSSLSKELKTVEKKKDNILETLSLANNEQMRKALLEKLSSLETEQGKISIKISSAKSQNRSEQDFVSVAQSVRDFMLNFESIFENAPIFERKEIFRRCISKIVVDRAKKVVRLSVRPLPAVQGIPLESAENKTALTDVLVSAASSGDTLQPAPTLIYPEIVAIGELKL
jgi:hypothetical protein